MFSWFRYTAEDLLELACEHGELRTLQRTLAASGHRGRKALMGICEKLSQAPGHRDGDGAGRAAERLPVQDRLQFVQRCHLAMHRPDLAGALEPPNHVLWDHLHNRLRVMMLYEDVLLCPACIFLAWLLDRAVN